MKEILTNDVFLDMLGKIAPAIITGIITFLITKYSYHKNMPLDKIEIAYNRVYYPIYRMIKNEEDIPKIIEKCEMYLKKYEKYADASTLRAFKNLKDNTNLSNEKKAYANLANNVYKMNSRLRRRLGYLEPNIFTMYTYSSETDKRIFRIVWELGGIYISALMLPSASSGYFFDMLCILLIFCIITLLIEGAFWLGQVIINFVMNLFSN